MDLTIAPILAAAALPISAVVAVVIRLRLGRPVLYTQLRAGEDDRPFRLYKFRTMTDESDDSGRLLADEHRLTPLGRRLRATSLDELPSLWNVLRGDMALVGPRPLPVAYLPRYSKDERQRHRVRPGLTGWSQVNGRNDIEWEERLRMDVWYVEHRSLALDLRVLASTVKVVMRRSGITSEGHATMPELRPELDDDAR